MNTVEWIAAGLGLVSVWLNVREDWRGWPVGAVMVALYFAVFARVKLYADAGPAGDLLRAAVLRLVRVGAGGENHGRLAVSRTPPRVLAACAAVGAAGTVLLGSVLGRYTDQALPFWDSGITAFSLVAQWMLAKKYLENWLLWAAIDVHRDRGILGEAPAAHRRAVWVLPAALRAGVPEMEADAG